MTEKKVDDLLAKLNLQRYYIIIIYDHHHHHYHHHHYHISAQLPGAQPMRHTVEELLGHALINERFFLY